MRVNRSISSRTQIWNAAAKCKEENSTLEATFPRTDNQLSYLKSRNVYWNKSNIVLVDQTQYLEGQPGKKRRNCTTLIIQISFSSAVTNARQPPCQITKKPSTQHHEAAEVPARQCEPYTKNLPGSTNTMAIQNLENKRPNNGVWHLLQ